jgi:alkylation response protein AidB-like acyl-CoA dehydrogenase
MAAVARITCNEMSSRVTSEAIQLHGGFDFTDEYAVSRLYRGARWRDFALEVEAANMIECGRGHLLDRVLRLPPGRLTPAERSWGE